MASKCPALWKHTRHVFDTHYRALKRLEHASGRLDAVQTYGRGGARASVKANAALKSAMAEATSTRRRLDKALASYAKCELRR